MNGPSGGSDRPLRPRRITLQAPRVELELPGASSAPVVADPSGELAIPDALVGNPSSRPPLPTADEDGWSRGRLTARLPGRSEARSDPPAALAPESSDAYRLISMNSRPPASSGQDLTAQLRDRLDVGDFSGALQLAELMLGREPGHAEAHEAAELARTQLIAFHVARLGGLRSVLRPTVRGAEVRWLGLDHRSGFLLSLLDGSTCVDDVVDLSAMPRHEALRLLAELLEGGVVEPAS